MDVYANSSAISFFLNIIVAVCFPLQWMVSGCHGESGQTVLGVVVECRWDLENAFLLGMEADIVPNSADHLTAPWKSVSSINVQYPEILFMYVIESYKIVVFWTNTQYFLSLKIYFGLFI